MVKKLSEKSFGPPLIDFVEDVRELEEDDTMIMEDETAEPLGTEELKAAFKARPSCVLHLRRRRDVPLQLPERLLPEDSEFLYRLCSPFNGKPNMFNKKLKCSPQHPCAMNWYMPNRAESNLLEVRLNWRLR